MQPRQPSGQVPEVGGGFPGLRKMTQSAVEGAAGFFGMAPSQGEPTLGCSTSGNREVHLAVGQREQDAGVGTERAEEVDLVVPRPGVAEVGCGRVIGVDHVDGEVLGPGVAVEASSR